MPPHVQTVSELTGEIKDLIEGNLPEVWVRGEVSNCLKANSGHVYFTLKDEGAQIAAVMWRNTAARIRFDMHDGLQVVVNGGVEVYKPRGSYQVIVRQLIPQGVGALELAFRQMHAKLEAEGLFNPARKRPIPRFPKRIALVTSPSGAAVRDMIQVITRRWKTADIVIVPVKVQGEDAAQQIAAALRGVHQLPNVDVVICGRGGGSLEDLWAFNEEVVARAIAACRLPVISAVGHEIDVTIADLVADVRALTPSEAGERVVPDRAEVLSTLDNLQQRLVSGLQNRAGKARLQLEGLRSRRVFTRPFQRVHDELTRVDEFDVRLRRAIRQRAVASKQQLDLAAATLDALSPLKVLGRGYSITRRAETGELVTGSEQLVIGDRITTILASGQLTSCIETTEHI
ncbi:MAG: exodeoxyribonuclease VII large subunit [Planctomycetes bacterium]|nr:exodeoxyribonuclease VII large subunit [Planctomycetota bacterium]